MAEVPAPAMPTVDAIYAAREREAAERPPYRSWGINASCLGTECDRALWYALRWATDEKPAPGLRLRIFERGEMEESRVIADLRRAGLDVLAENPDTGRQFRFELAGGLVRGKADGRCAGVIEAPKAEHVIEIKTLKAADWRAIRKHGLRKAKPEHWHQLHAGMAGLGVARGLYIGVNRDTEELLTERLHLDAEEAARQVARVESIAADHTGPQRINDAADAFPCRFCDHAPVCHGGAMPLRNCRTCLHFTFIAGPAGHCARFDVPLSPRAQQEDGPKCPAHLFLPGLVPGEQVDVDLAGERVLYRLRDGSEWWDGGSDAAR